LLTVVAVTIVVLLLFRQDLSVGQVFAPAGAAVAYITNIFNWSNHFFAAQDYFNYTWTLSIEEQFYLLWPVALLWGHRRDRRLFAALTVSLIGITLALNLYLGLSRDVIFDPHEYDGTDTNALPILVGSLLAIVCSQRLAVPGAAISCTLCAAGRCAPVRPGVSERHRTRVPGDRRRDRIDVGGVDRCRDAAAIDSWIAAGERADAVAGRAGVLDLSLEYPGANRDTQYARAYGSR
jgi:hypothetical protein